jgi:hypothetical protein
MQKLTILAALSLVLFISGCSTPGAYIAPEYHSEISQLHTIAIVPYTIRATEQGKAGGPPAEVKKAIDESEAISFQFNLFTAMQAMENAQLKKITLQDPGETNRRLLAAGINLHAMSTYEPLALCDAAGVDGIILPALLKSGYRGGLLLSGGGIPQADKQDLSHGAVEVSATLYSKKPLRMWSVHKKGKVNWELPPSSTLKEMHDKMLAEFPKE